MFVCILFCGFNETNVTEAHEPSSLTAATSTPHDFKKQHISVSDRLLFNTTKLILCYPTRDASFVTGASVPRNGSKTHFSMT